MKLPEVRAELLQIGQNIGGVTGARIIWLAEETRRRPPVRRAPPRREPRVARAQLVGFFRINPCANFQDAARHFGVNIRAVSYAYRGPRQ
jgi:hypothetical protein